MGPSFVFEPPSDEEIELSEAEEDEDQVEEDEDEDEDEVEGERQGSKTSNRHTQSPWDFASFSESVAEEHARRSTTSVDFKISKVLQQRSVPDSNLEGDESDSSESEPDRQVSISLFFALNS